MRATGIVLIVLGVLVGLVGRFVEDAVAAGIVTASALALILSGGFTLYRSKQYAALRTAPDDLAPSGDRVLYLRSFAADSSVTRQTFSALLTANLVTGLTTEEEMLAAAVRPVGRLTAIGKPGERLPTPRAARVYVPDAEWQANVSEQMAAARLVVLRLGDTDGLQWEIARAREMMDPRRLLLLMPGGRKQAVPRMLARRAGVAAVSAGAHRLDPGPPPGGLLRVHAELGATVPASAGTLLPTWVPADACPLPLRTAPGVRQARRTMGRPAGQCGPRDDDVLSRGPARPPTRDAGRGSPRLRPPERAGVLQGAAHTGGRPEPRPEA